VSSSTVGPVKSALVSLLTASLQTAQVIYGPIETKTVTTQDVVTVGNVVGTPRFASLSQTRLAEDYEVEISISCSRTGPDSQQAATEAAMAMYVAAMTVVLAGDGTLGLANVQSAQPTTEFQLTEKAEATERNALVVFNVAVQASE
jgi:hypothetical protein